MNLFIPIHVANDWSVNKDLDPAFIKFMLKRLYHATIKSHVINDLVFFTITIIDIYFRRIENMTKRLFALMIWNKTENRFNKQRDSVLRSWKWRQWKCNFVQIWKIFQAYWETLTTIQNTVPKENFCFIYKRIQSILEW